MKFTEKDVGKHVQNPTARQTAVWLNVANRLAAQEASKEHAVKVATSAAGIAEDLLTSFKEIGSKYQDCSLVEFQEAQQAADDLISRGCRISLQEGKWHPFREAAELSFDEIQDKIRARIRGMMQPLDVWPYLQETYSDKVIVEMEAKGDSARRHFQYPYTITDGEITLGDPVEVKQVWQTVTTTDEEEHVQAQEAAVDFDCAFVPFQEASAAGTPFIGPDGKARLKLITPGWGSSAYYGEELLERDAAVFEGAQMFWNHQTAEEEKQRPEGDLDKLAAKITGKPKYDAKGPRGPGVYAEAQVFEKFRKPIEELAPHIGLSIRAGGVAKKGEAEGKTGLIAEALKVAKSVDFVTKPGAGGEILNLFEAAGRTAQPQETEEGVDEMDLTKLTLAELKEARKDLVDAVQAEFKEVHTQGESELVVQLKEAQKQLAKLAEKNLLADAKEVINAKLQESKLPKRVQARLFQEAIGAELPVTEGALDSAKLGETVTVSIKEAQEEISELLSQAGGRIKGMGESKFQEAGEFDAEKNTASLIESFRNMGMSEEEAKIAARG